MKDLASIIWENTKTAIEQRTNEVQLRLRYFPKKAQEIKQEYEAFLREIKKELIEKLGDIDEIALEKFYELKRKKIEYKN